MDNPAIFRQYFNCTSLCRTRKQILSVPFFSEKPDLTDLYKKLIDSFFPIFPIKFNKPIMFRWPITRGEL
jgi:hypothetical protein